MRRAGIDVRPQEVHAHSAPVTALVGDIAPYQAPAPRNDQSPKAGTPKPARSRRRRSAGAVGKGRGGHDGSATAKQRRHSGSQHSASAWRCQAPAFKAFNDFGADDMEPQASISRRMLRRLKDIDNVETPGPNTSDGRAALASSAIVELEAQLIDL